MTSKVACLILNYNDFETTSKLLGYISGYDSIDYIVVVDNCSTDDSYSKLCNIKMSKLSVIKTEWNGGYGYGNNCGIRWIAENTNSNYVLISNPDVLFSNAFVIKMIKNLKENSQAAISTGLMKNYQGKIDYLCAWHVPTVSQYVFSASPFMNIITNAKKNMHYDKSVLSRGNIIPVGCVAGSLLMVELKKMMKFGMYDEQTFLYCEETTLGTKFQRAGVQTLLDTSESFIHNHSVTINKTFGVSFSGFKKKKTLWLKSKLKYLRNYSNINGVRLILVEIYFRYLIYELWFYQCCLDFRTFLKH